MTLIIGLFIGIPCGVIFGIFLAFLHVVSIVKKDMEYTDWN